MTINWVWPYLNQVLQMEKALALSARLNTHAALDWPCHELGQLCVEGNADNIANAIITFTQSK